MRTRQLTALLMLTFCAAGLTGCGKTSGQELADKKAKELRKGTFHNPPAKSFGI
jgi:hypothetical protein